MARAFEKDQPPFADWYDEMGFSRSRGHRGPQGGQEQCADMFGVSTRAVRYWLSGERWPPRHVIKMIIQMEHTEGAYEVGRQKGREETS